MSGIKFEKPILVTGSHCSGTTWVGRMIATSSDVTYIHEPFNIEHDIGICNARFDRWFTYVTEHNECKYYKSFENTVALRYNPLGFIKTAGKPGHVASATRNFTRFLSGRARNNRALIKDPIALFSAEWLSSTFEMDTIVMIRHPAAFAGSVKLKNRSHPFSDFLEQPILMQDLLYPFADEIEYFAKNERHIIDQAALLWKLIHYTILKFQERNSNWSYVRHEDLSLEPQKGFKSLFGTIGLEFSDQVSNAIAQHSSGDASGGSELDGPQKKIKRESASNIQSWKKRLTPSEVERIRTQVQDISREFYSDEEW